MNQQAYVDGFVACALAAHAGGIPAEALTGTFSAGYAEGWIDALKDARMFRCCASRYVDFLANEHARYALALRSDHVRGCDKCGGAGRTSVLVGGEWEPDQCRCIDEALERIAQEIGR